MTETLNFPEKIKKYLILNIKDNINYFSKKNDGLKELFENNYFYLDEENKKDKNFIENLQEFIKDDFIKSTIIKNINFCNPKTINRISELMAFSIPLCEPFEFLLDIFNDFINYTIRLCINEKQQDKLIEEHFSNFEHDFFSDEIPITFIANISRFYYYSSDIENLITNQDLNVKVKYLLLRNNTNKNIYFTLKKNFKTCYSNTLSDEIKNYPTIIEYTTFINKNENLNDLMDKTEDIFNKIFLAARLICGGSMHFDFIRPFFIGNYTSITPIIKEFPENHLFTYNDKETTINNGPFEVWINRILESLLQRDYFKWVFVDQKIRDSYYRNSILNSKIPFSYKFKASKQVERLIDLIQGIENIMGGYGSSNRKPLGKLLSKGEINKENEIEELIKNLYEIRDKYIHGSNKIFSIIKNKYKTNTEFEKDIDRLEYILKQTIIFDILNEDFGDKIQKYIESLKPPMEYKIIGEANPIPFPKLNTINY